MAATKHITSLGFDPLTLSLRDREVSLFVDPVAGDVFVDEGDGPDRMNGVVFTPRNGPRFELADREDGSLDLTLVYGGTSCTIGHTDKSLANELRQWVAKANTFLAGFDNLETPQRMTQEIPASPKRTSA